MYFPSYSLTEIPAFCCFACRRFVRIERTQLRSMTASAIEDLKSFFVVGVVEQYEGFIEVLKKTLDPEAKYSSLWKAATEVRKNG